MGFLLRVLIGLIRVYQHTLSPDHGVFKGAFPGGVCRFEPTCSEYGVGAIKKYGWRGIMITVRRVGRCHPFSSGGYDPVT